MYEWRRMSLQEREETLKNRQSRRRPWHSPPHRYLSGKRRYSVSAACYEHESILAYSAERLDQFTHELLHIMERESVQIHAWCILPNHYHLMFMADDLKRVLSSLGRLHGRSSHAWNNEENQRGRRVWCNYIDREMRSDRHFWATMNYVHNNPVQHGYVERWQDWPWSSADQFLKQFGRERAKEIWTQYPINEFDDLRPEFTL